jgi:hypothetical protein
VAVLVCLVVIMLISGVLLKIGVAHRDRLRRAERSLQAQWLAQSGLDRALARLAASSGYAGETWLLTPSDLGLPQTSGGEPAKAAIVRITVETPAGSLERRLINVQADFPPDLPYRARRSSQMLVELGSLQRGASQ